MEAFDRGDADELRRLSQTCPEGRYWSQDPRYVERIKASRVAALMAANFISKALFAFSSVVSAKDVRLEVLDSLEKEAPEMVEKALESDESASVKRMYAGRAAVSFGVCVGIARFCDSIGVEARKLLGLEPDCLPAWELLSAWAKDRVHDDVTAQDVCQRLASEWALFVDDWVHEGWPTEA
jgi:hypothetical protein